MPPLQRWSERKGPSLRTEAIVGASVAAVIAAAVLASVSVASAPARAAKGSEDCPPQGQGVFRGVRYEEFVTGDPGGASGDELPLVFAFHGRGATPLLMRAVMEDLPVRARVVVPEGPLALGANSMWWRTRASGDQDALAREMAKSAKVMGAWIHAFARCRAVRGAPLVVGHSQGGMLALAIAARPASHVGAAVVASAWLPELLQSSDMAEAYLLHGDEDSIVDFERTVGMIEEVTAQGNDWDIEVVQGHGHGLSGRLRSAWLARIAQVSGQ